ncbi:MAG: hypothetical protein KAI24_16695 [Planctomycetes bacterium]|nr:hypothetical protein [Planctomycetota bacterium]
MKRGPMVALALLAALGSGCAPDPNLQELVKEMRADRLAQRQRAGGDRGQASSAELLEAMAPLRDVLAQLGRSQRELSERQATLAKEMRQWTQLLVESVHSKQSERAEQLGKRLEQLELEMAAQDARHREVEELLGKALDRTADQLENFLQRVGGAGQPPADPVTPAPESAGGTEGGAGATSAPAKPAGGGEPEAAGPGERGGDDQQAGLQQAAAWPLWAVAILAIGAGVWLLLPSRRRDQLRVAPEMQVDDRGASELDVVGLGASDSEAAAVERFGDARFDPVPVAPLPEPDAAPAPGTSDDPAADGQGPEVEELWTAAALLGEAIGRLKQSGGTIPADLQRALGAEAAAAHDESRAPVEPAPATGQHAVLGGEDPLRPAAPASEDEFELDEFFVIDDEGPNAAAAAPPPVRPSIAEPAVEPAGAPAAEPVASAPRPDSITCRLPVADAAAAESNVMAVLGCDPRVLVQPAPRVQRGSHALEVSFSLLPGLSAGERALLEQRVRDAAI